MAQPELKRKFGAIPEWAKKGPVDLQNYDLRAEWYGATIKRWGDRWPYLSRNPNWPATADEAAWERYFSEHLGGYPTTFHLFRDGVMPFLNMPEARPELFDMSYGGAAR